MDVATQNGKDDSTRRALPGGYVYDAIYAVPDEGPTSGGAKIEINGQNTHFDATTVVKIGGVDCTDVTVQSETTLSCTVPASTPGAKTLQVKTGDESIIVLDGYNYQDSDNGFKGGLDGAPLGGKLKVLVFDNYTGEAIPGATAIVGTDIQTALIGQADGNGVVLFDDASLVTPKTVTITDTATAPRRSWTSLSTR